MANMDRGHSYITTTSKISHNASEILKQINEVEILNIRVRGKFKLILFSILHRVVCISNF